MTASRLTLRLPNENDAPALARLMALLGHLAGVADWYGDRANAASQSETPRGPDAGQFRVVRGGSWLVSFRDSRILARSSFVPSVRFGNIGTRCAREVAA